MISCTEFIPSYSELFSYLEENHGEAEVRKFWTYLFAPTGKGIPLINFARKDGLRGCWDYWMGTLTEEAAHVTKWMSESSGWIYSKMHYCPSKGRLLELEKEIGLKPYHNYCGHCDYYRAALEEVGLTWFRNHMNVDKAGCESYLFDPKVFKGVVEPSEDMEIMDIKPGDFEYFHPDFHSSLNMGIHYLGENFGLEELRAYLIRYTNNVYVKVFADIAERGLAAVEAMILDTYAKEKCPDAVKTTLDDKGLLVEIAYCPAVKHLLKTCRDVTPWYRYSTEVVMEVMAGKCGCSFSMDAYDDTTGKAQYRFIL